MPAIKIFISYAKEENKFLQELIKNCKSFIPYIYHNSQRYTIKWMWDELIHPAEDWDSEIQKMVKDADLVVCLLSPDFMNSSYVWNNEIALAIERRKSVGIGILGVLVKACDFGKTEISRFQFVPQKKAVLKPISEWTNKKECWGFIAEAIKIGAKNSIDRLPIPLQYRPETLSASSREKYMQQFSTSPIQKFAKRVKRKKTSKVKKQKGGWWKKWFGI